MNWDYEDDLSEPKLVDRSLDMQSITKQFEMLNQLFCDSALLNKKTEKFHKKRVQTVFTGRKIDSFFSERCESGHVFYT